MNARHTSCILLAAGLLRTFGHTLRAANVLRSHPLSIAAFPVSDWKGFTTRPVSDVRVRFPPSVRMLLQSGRASSARHGLLGQQTCLDVLLRLLPGWNSGKGYIRLIDCLISFSARCPDREPGCTSRALPSAFGSSAYKKGLHHDGAGPFECRLWAEDTQLCVTERRCRSARSRRSACCWPRRERERT